MPPPYYAHNYIESPATIHPRAIYNRRDSDSATLLRNETHEVTTNRSCVCTYGFVGIGMALRDAYEDGHTVREYFFWRSELKYGSR